MWRGMLLLWGMGTGWLPGALAADVVAPQTYLVGVARREITPNYPIRLSGFGFRRTESEGVTAPLFARALAIGADEEGPAVLLTVDTTGVPDAITAEVARRLAPLGVRRERLAITGTHTHTAPMLQGVLATLFGQPVPAEHQAHIEQYTAEFTAHLEQVARAALADRQPAHLGWAVGAVHFAKNRRQANGPVDHDLPVLAVRSPAGQLRAVLATYACHAVTLSHNFVGGDWPGFAAEAIERDFPGAVALISIGCGADQNPTSGVTGDKVEVARGQGLELAAEVRRIVQGALAPLHGALTARLERIDLPLADLPPRAHWEALANKPVEPGKTDYIGYHAKVQLATLDRGIALPTKIEYPVQTWAFGDSLALVFLPGEVVVDYALRLKREFERSRLWVTAYANDTPCYIPSERVLQEGGYEGGTAMTYYNLPAKLQTGVEQRIVDAVRRTTPASFLRPATQRPEPNPPALPAAQSQRRLQIPADCTAQLVAVEPLITDPVAIDFGPDGALWVCEMHDYPAGLQGNFEPGGRIRLLRDDDGDGVYDRATVFLDDLPFPTGVTVWRNGVLVCAAPDILYAEDTDGDDRADVRRVLFSGFGTENYQARVNSLTYGLDGWVYGACGLFGGAIKSHLTGETIALGHRDFRIDPDRGLLEPLAGRTQQGRVRNDDGDWFGCNNSQPLLHYPLRNDATPPGLILPPLTVVVPRGPDALQLFPLLATAQRFALSGPAGRVTAACGLGVYRDDWIASLQRGDALVCEPVNLIVHRLRVAPQGATFAAQRVASETQSEFLASTDNWFRPVQVRTGPDGGLWVVDMSRAVIEHPRWIPEDVRAGLDVRAGDTQGRIYRLLPRDRGPRAVPRFDRLTSAELVEQLRSPNGTVRDLAQQLLLWRDERSVAPQLRAVVASDAPSFSRTAALWVLARWNELPRDLLASALRDADPAVRRQAAAAVGYAAAARPADAALLQRLDAEEQPGVVLEVAQALQQRTAPWKVDLIASLYARHRADPTLSFALLRSVEPDEWPQFVSRVADMQPNSDEALDALLRRSLALRDPAALQTLLPRLLASDADVERIRWSLVEQVFTARRRQGASFDELLTPDVQHRLAHLAELARALFAAPETPEETRLAVAGVLGSDAGQRDADVSALLSRLTAQSSPALQQRVVAVLDQLDDPRVPGALLARQSSVSPAARTRILDSLLSRPAGARALLDAVAAGTLPAAHLDAVRRQALLQHRDAGVRTHAASLFAAAADTSRAEVVARHQHVLALTGDPARGREVFTKRCVACHAFEGKGFAVGPDLGESRNKSWSAILTALLDPNRAVDERYVVYTAVTTDGRTLQGLLTSESETAITLKGQEAKITTLARAELEELATSDRSLMPEGLERDLAPQDFADVCALITQKSESGEQAAPPIAEVAKRILDDARPQRERQVLVVQEGARAAELITALSQGLGNDAKEEYRRIPWIWRVAINAGKQNDADSLRKILAASLPAADGPLADWQAVVIGGGVINGVSQAGAWPHERIAELIGNDRALQARWRRALDESVTMADREATPKGTRYDALRIVALDGWDRRGAQLVKYLGKDVHAELQMGAVSALVDVPAVQATTALLQHLADLQPRNRELALDGLLRSEDRMLALLEAVAARRVATQQLGEDRVRKLREAASERVRTRAAAVFSQGGR